MGMLPGTQWPRWKLWGGLAALAGILTGVWFAVSGRLTSPDATAFVAVSEWFDRDGVPAELPERLVAGESVDRLLRVRPSNESPTEIAGRKVAPPERWRLRVTWTNPAGETLERPLDGARVETELHPLELVIWRNSYASSDGEASSFLEAWESPGWPSVWGTKSGDNEALVRWGHFAAPFQPGRYQVVVTVHPTATPANDAVMYPGEFGPGLILAERAVEVLPSSRIAPKSLSVMARTKPTENEKRLVRQTMAMGRRVQRR